METYSVLRQFADSWGMLAMLLTFLGLIAYAVLSRSKGHSDAAHMIFRNEDSPADATTRRDDTVGAGKERDQ